MARKLTRSVRNQTGASTAEEATHRKKNTVKLRERDNREVVKETREEAYSEIEFRHSQ